MEPGCRGADNQSGDGFYIGMEYMVKRDSEDFIKWIGNITGYTIKQQ